MYIKFYKKSKHITKINEKNKNYDLSTDKSQSHVSVSRNLSSNALETSLKLKSKRNWPRFVKLFLKLNDLVSRLYLHQRSGKQESKQGKRIRQQAQGREIVSSPGLPHSFSSSTYLALSKLLVSSLSLSLINYRSTFYRIRPPLSLVKDDTKKDTSTKSFE